MSAPATAGRRVRGSADGRRRHSTRQRFGSRLRQSRSAVRPPRCSWRAGDVPHVGVAADHRHDSGERQLREVFGHHRRGAAQETVRRRRHARHPDRNQPIQPTLVRLDDLIDRIPATIWWNPVPQRRARNPIAQALPQRVPLGTRGSAAAQRGIVRAVSAFEYDVAAGRRRVDAHSRTPPRRGIGDVHRTRPNDGSSRAPKEEEDLQTPEVSRGTDARRLRCSPRSAVVDTARVAAGSTANGSRKRRMASALPSKGTRDASSATSVPGNRNGLTRSLLVNVNGPH
jgi:hypothetical protein